MNIFVFFWLQTAVEKFKLKYHAEGKSLFVKMIYLLHTIKHIVLYALTERVYKVHTWYMNCK